MKAPYLFSFCASQVLKLVVIFGPCVSPLRVCSTNISKKPTSAKKSVQMPVSSKVPRNQFQLLIHMAVNPNPFCGVLIFRSSKFAIAIKFHILNRGKWNDCPFSVLKDRIAWLHPIHRFVPNFWMALETNDAAATQRCLNKSKYFHFFAVILGGASVNQNKKSANSFWVFKVFNVYLMFQKCIVGLAYRCSKFSFQLNSIFTCKQIFCTFDPSPTCYDSEKMLCVCLETH